VVGKRLPLLFPWLAFFKVPSLNLRVSIVNSTSNQPFPLFIKIAFLLSIYKRHLCCEPEGYTRWGLVLLYLFAQFVIVFSGVWPEPGQPASQLNQFISFLRFFVNIYFFKGDFLGPVHCK